MMRPLGNLNLITAYRKYFLTTVQLNFSPSVIHKLQLVRECDYPVNRPIGSERPDVASLDPDPQSHLVLSRAATRQQIGHYLRGPHPAGSHLQHRPVLSTAPSSLSLRISGIPQDLQHDATHRTVLRSNQTHVLGRCPTLRTRVTTRPKVDQDASDTARGDHHSPLLPVRPAHLPSSRMEPIPAHASRHQP